MGSLVLPCVMWDRRGAGGVYTAVGQGVDRWGTMTERVGPSGAKKVFCHTLGAKHVRYLQGSALTARRTRDVATAHPHRPRQQWTKLGVCRGQRNRGHGERVQQALLEPEAVGAQVWYKCDPRHSAIRNDADRRRRMTRALVYGVWNGRGMPIWNTEASPAPRVQRRVRQGFGGGRVRFGLPRTVARSRGRTGVATVEYVVDEIGLGDAGGKGAPLSVGTMLREAGVHTHNAAGAVPTLTSESRSCNTSSSLCGAVNRYLPVERVCERVEAAVEFARQYTSKYRRRDTRVPEPTDLAGLSRRALLRKLCPRMDKEERRAVHRLGVLPNALLGHFTSMFSLLECPCDPAAPCVTQDVMGSSGFCRDFTAALTVLLEVRRATRCGQCFGPPRKPGARTKMKANPSHSAFRRVAAFEEGST